MARKEQTLAEYVNNEIVYRDYSHTELQDFHNKVQPFYFDHTTIMGEKLRVIDMHKLKVAFGAITPKGKIILKGIIKRDDGSIKSFNRPTRLEEFENIWKQYQNWKVDTGLDKGSAGFKKLQQLDEIAGQMKVEPAPEEIPF
jgi:hypothetical protein